MIYTGLVKFIIIYIKKKEIQVDDLVDGYKVVMLKRNIYIAVKCKVRKI